IMALHPLIDAILVGQPEVAAYEFINFCTQKKENCSKQFSFAYRASTSNNIVIDPIITNTLSLDELPLPKRTIEVREATSHVNLEASRGCHFNCSFCHLSKTSVSFRSPQNVL